MTAHSFEWWLLGVVPKRPDRGMMGRIDRSFERTQWWLIHQDGKSWALFPHLGMHPDLKDTLFRARYWRKKKRWVIDGFLRTKLAMGPPGGLTPFEIMRRKIWVVWGGNTVRFAPSRVI